MSDASGEAGPPLRPESATATRPAGDIPPRLPIIAFDVGLDYARGRGTGVGLTVVDFRMCLACLMTRESRFTVGEVFGLGFGAGGGSGTNLGIYYAFEIELGVQASVRVTPEVELGLRYSMLARANAAFEGKSISNHYRDDFWTVTPRARVGPVVAELLFATDVVPFPSFLRTPTDQGRMLGGVVRYLLGQYHIAASYSHFTAEPTSAEIRLGVGMNY